ncbi:hypothetical protein L486_00285 [Kwoniella mangroviensis CBS 10435]|uniref:Uncharacterized protein n=1 Tax=Kwoniella mangroviensis CBS 10435 TaxID=1331196 RepID=A0A1B9IYN9_9TREE|nr:uncharacterized protein I203_06395 [Kwoniella mangroviensis CBS 8507]OCF60649.1 hypothetical protein L486_00285 [Kwoniella mangroviensis CBS 10435]OCF64660.1 hypothetical protein I203_06395 [Kwoniella mangroviensis CBS 8507]OCF74602.1 hypothetical protein I204_04981 [Kwoniella mangroviensis CBS 8886]
MSIRSSHLSIGSIAGPSRPSFAIRKYATQPSGQQNQNISEMINRKAISSAWRALSPNQKLIFGGLVALGAYFEYSLLDRYVLGPIKLRKEDERRIKAEQNMGIGGGEGQKEVFLGE